MVEDVLRGAPVEPAAGATVRLRRPWWSRLSRAHALALLAALLAAGLNVVALRDHDAHTPVLVAAGDLAAGSALEDGSVRPSPLRAEPATLGALVTADQFAQRRGWLLARPVRDGEPLRWSDLRDPRAADGPRAMSLPIEREHAVGGALHPGDRVDVIAVREGQASWVLSDVEVLDVQGGDTAGLGAAPVHALILAVTEAQALRLAWAMHDGAVEVVRSTGAPVLGDAAAVVGGGRPAGDAHGAPS